MYHVFFTSLFSRPFTIPQVLRSRDREVNVQEMDEDEAEEETGPKVFKGKRGRLHLQMIYKHIRAS